METKNGHGGSQEGIAFGLDYGSTGIRAAYHLAAEDGQGAVVTVPTALDRTVATFPIVETLVPNDAFVPRFYPGLSQRLASNFCISFQGVQRQLPEVMEMALSHVAETVEKYAGQKIARARMIRSSWADLEAEALLQAAARRAGLTDFMLVDPLEALGAFYRHRRGESLTPGTVLVFSAGYTGLEMAAVRVTPKAVRLLGEQCRQGLLAGNIYDYAIIHAALRSLHRAGISMGTPDAFRDYSHLQYVVQAAKNDMQDDHESVWEMPLPFTLGATAPVRFRVDGAAFRRLVESDMEEARVMLEHLMGAADVRPEEIHAVLLHGGTTHCSVVPAKLAEWFPGIPQMHLPRDAQAVGAALLALEPRYRPPDLVEGPAQGSEFIPALIPVEGLVHMLDQQAAGAPVEPMPALPAASEEAQRPTQTLTLQAIRDDLQAGLRDRALADLKRLKCAVEEELKSIPADQDQEGPCPSTYQH
jgi:hypothetical protein